MIPRLCLPSGYWMSTEGLLLAWRYIVYRQAFCKTQALHLWCHKQGLPHKTNIEWHIYRMTKATARGREVCPHPCKVQTLFEDRSYKLYQSSGTTGIILAYVICWIICCISSITIIFSNSLCCIISNIGSWGVNSQTIVVFLALP